MSDEWEEVKGGELFEFKKENDSVEGELIDVRSEVGKHKSTMYDVKLDDGKLVSFFGSTVLDGKMKRVQIGNIFKVEFKGTVKPEKGNSYKDFDVFIRKTSPTDNDAPAFDKGAV